MYARSKTDNIIVEADVDENGRYVLTISDFDLVFDLYVNSDDSGLDSPVTTRGCREIRNLQIG